MQEKKSKIKLRFRFGLRSFLIGITAICIWFGLTKVQADKQAAIVDKVRLLGGKASYDFQFDESGEFDPALESPIPQFLIDWLGRDVFHDVTQLDMLGASKPGYLVAQDFIMRIEDQETWRFRGDQITMSLEIFDQISTLESLKHISLPSIEGMDELFEKRISKLKSLESFLIQKDSDLTDKGIACLRGLEHLKKVSIVNSKIGDDSLKVFGRMSNLKALYLHGHVFSDAGVEELSELKNLKLLVLDGPTPKVRLLGFVFGTGKDKSQIHPDAISGKGLEPLALGGLKYLSLCNTRVSKEVANELQRRNPKCTVIFDAD